MKPGTKKTNNLKSETNVSTKVDEFLLFITGINQCQQLLSSSDPIIERYIRKGDIYAVMIQNLVNSDNVTLLKQTFAEMRHYLEVSGNIGIAYYLSGDIIQQLCKALGVSQNVLIPQKNTPSTEDTEETEQEILEAVEEN